MLHLSAKIAFFVQFSTINFSIFLLKNSGSKGGFSITATRFFLCGCRCLLKIINFTAKGLFSMKYDVFISYSRKDFAMVKKITDELGNAGYECWMEMDKELWL